MSVTRSSFFTACLLVMGVVGGCTSADDPYDALSDAELEYIIPDSSELGSGELCPGETMCSGRITIEEVERYDWFHISDLQVLDGDVSRSVPVQLSVTEARSRAPFADEMVVDVWGPSVDRVEDAIASGVDVWAGVDPVGDYAMTFAAFDAEGRVAGIGEAAAEYLAVPVARLAAEANAPSAFEFLDPAMTR